VNREAFLVESKQSPVVDEAWLHESKQTPVEVIGKGDVDGHPFRGNQWSEGKGDGPAVPIVIRTKGGREEQADAKIVAGVVEEALNRARAMGVPMPVKVRIGGRMQRGSAGEMESSWDAGGHLPTLIFSDNPNSVDAETVFHELGHAAHVSSMTNAQRFRVEEAEEFKPAEEKVARRVSGYAATAPGEFVAEVFAQHLSGKRHGPGVMALYRRWHGPPLPRRIRKGDLPGHEFRGNQWTDGEGEAEDGEGEGDEGPRTWGEDDGLPRVDLPEDEDSDPAVYHVTTADRLEEIAAHGLVPGAASTAGRGGVYESHSKGRVFTTDRAGVEFWRQRVEAHAADQHDDPPPVVVLRIDPEAWAREDFAVDDVGTRDMPWGEAMFTADKIAAEDISVVRDPAMHKGDLPGHPFRGNQHAEGVTVYHGTFMRHLPSIATEGITVAGAKSRRNFPEVTQGRRARAVYVATDKDEAYSWARSADVNDAEVPIVLTVRLPGDVAARLDSDSELDPELHRTLEEDIKPEWIVEAHEATATHQHRDPDKMLVTFRHDWKAVPIPVKKGDFLGHPFRGNQWTSPDGDRYTEGGASMTGEKELRLNEDALSAAGFWRDNPVDPGSLDHEGGPRGQSWVRANPSTATAAFDRVDLPISKVILLPGHNDEHVMLAKPSPDEEVRLAALEASIREKGYDAKNPIMVWVEADGTTKIAEGNHRVRAARRAGLKTIPVDLRYFGGAEARNGEWSPASVLDHMGKPATFMVQGKPITLNKGDLDAPNNPTDGGGRATVHFKKE
jgi:hypothetical protein